MKPFFRALCLLMLASSAQAAERSLTDDTGRTLLIPEKPERVVILHEPLLGIPALDLGTPVVGSYGRDDDGTILTKIDFIETVLNDPATKPPGIGPIGEIDLEKLRALKPDLILGTEHDGDKAAQLSKIAPLYLQNVSTGLTYGYSVEKDLAKVLNRLDDFNARETTYQAKLDATRNTYMPKDKELTYLGIIVHDQLNLIGNMSGAIKAIEDLGYTRARFEGDTGINKGMGSTFSVPLSPELFGRLNPDLLIIMNSYVNGDRGESGIRARLDKIVPGWDRFLKPVKEGRMLFLDSAKVATPSIASAIQTLDAFEDWAAKRP